MRTRQKRPGRHAALAVAAAALLSAAPDLASLHQGASCTVWERRDINLRTVEAAAAEHRRLHAAPQSHTPSTQTPSTQTPSTQTPSTQRAAEHKDGETRSQALQAAEAAWHAALRQQTNPARKSATDATEWIQGRWSGCSVEQAASGRTSARQARYYAHLATLPAEHTRPPHQRQGR